MFDREGLRLDNEIDTSMSIKDYQTALEGFKIKEAAAESAHLKKFLQKIIAPIGFCNLEPLLLEPEIFDARSAALKTEFESDPDWQEPFRKMVKSARQGAEDYSLTEAIRLFGNRQTRLWLMSARLGRGLKLKELTVDPETGRALMDGNTALKFAIAAQGKFGEDSRYKDVTFAAGFLFDYLFHLHHSSWLDMGGKKIDDFMNNTFNQCIDSGLASVAMCRHVKKVSLEKWVPAYVLVWHAGRVCMALIVPGYLDFLKKMEKENVAPPIVAWKEKELFGVTSMFFGQLLGSIHPVFDRLGSAVLLQGHQYSSWVSGQKDTHDLSAIGSLGFWLKTGGKGVADGSSAGTIRPEIASLEYTYQAIHYKEAK